ncbi:MAG: ATP-binding protein [Cyclobacteriaceae bacterium]
MNLKRKLALRSTLVCAITLLTIFMGTFYFFRLFTLQQYFRRLDERALVTAFIFLEKDELSKRHYYEYEQKYLQSLDDEQIQIYDSTSSHAFIDFDPEFPVGNHAIEKIRNEGKTNFRVGERQFSGIFYEDNQGDFVIIVSGINHQGLEHIQNLGYLLILFFILGLTINYIFNLLVAKKTFKPFSELLHRVNTISTENLHDRVPLNKNTKDELSELSATINTFLDRIEREVDNQKSVIKNISHELKTPLTAIIGVAEVSLEREQSDYKKVLRKIVRDTSSLKSVIESLLLMSGLNTQNQRFASATFRIDELVWEVLEKLKIKYPDSIVHTTLNVELDNENLLVVSSHRDLLATALLNIIDNATKYSQNENPEIVISIKEGRPAIVVKDNGPGIPDDDIDNVFELFYRGSNIRHIPGHGIGLSLTQQIVEYCQTQMHIDSNNENGTQVTLVF